MHTATTILQLEALFKQQPCWTIDQLWGVTSVIHIFLQELVIQSRIIKTELSIGRKE
jgi:hypothetical protein